MCRLYALLVIFLLSACSSLQPPPPVVTDTPPPIVREVRVMDGVSLGLSSALVGWTVSDEAPKFLIEESVHHIRHDLEAQGQNRKDDEIIAVVHKRLSANELYIYRQSSQASIVVDFSPLKNGELIPARKIVFDSANFAVGSLSQEEGVTDVVHQVSSAALFGADYAFRLDADFRSHGEPRRFSGLIGFADPYWIYIYYTERLSDPADYRQINTLLDTLSIIRK